MYPTGPKTLGISPGDSSKPGCASRSLFLSQHSQGDVTSLLLPCSQNFCPASHLVSHHHCRASASLWCEEAAWLHSHLSPGCRDPFPSPGLSVCQPCRSPLAGHPVSVTLNICCTCLFSQSIFTHPRPHLPHSLGRLVLTFSWPLVPVFPRPLLPSSSFCCVYPILLLVLSVTPTSLSHPTPSKCFLSQTHHCDVCKTHGNSCF